MYDSFSIDYDRFVNWPNRLALEIPFIERELGAILQPRRPIRILDTACGTGMHAIELARRGYEVTGVDISPKMIERAKKNASKAGTEVRFEVLGFGELAETFTNFNALLCLGNSLPHILNPVELSKTLMDFAACLRPTGVLLIQNRNFDAVLANRQRWMEPQSYQDAGQEWIFLRFYDFDPDGLLTFHIITLHRSGQMDWQQKLINTRLYPFRRDELVSALQQSGFRHIACYGGTDSQPFNPETSGNLVVLATL